MMTLTRLGALVFPNQRTPGWGGVFLHSFSYHTIISTGELLFVTM